MLSQNFRLPARAVKVNSNAISRSAGTLLGALVIAAILAFMAFWQIPSLLRDTQIRNAPVVLYDGDVENGKCTARQGIFVDCSAHLSYDYNGQHFESDVKLFFIDFHNGDYTVDLVIAGDKPELATISIALDKYWNRVILLAVFLLGFAALIGAAVVTSLRVARARRQLAVPGRLSLVEVDVAETGVKVRSRMQYSYQAANSKQQLTTLFDKGQVPLVIWDTAGVPHGYAVKHEGADIPVLLDRGLERIDLTPEERSALLEVIAAAENAGGQPPAKPGVMTSAFGGFLATMRRLLLLIIGVIIIAVGYWLYYVLGSTNSHDKIGMDINSMMPAAVNEWACGKLELRFGDRNAPYGCTAADYTSWK